MKTLLSHARAVITSSVTVLPQFIFSYNTKPCACMLHVVLVGAKPGAYVTAEAAAAAAAPCELPLIKACANEAEADDALRVFGDAPRVVYVDGSSLRNGKPDAAATYGVFYGKDDARNASGPVKHEPRSNNVAELEAIECALQQEQARGASDGLPLVIVTDSGYAINCLTAFYGAWARNGWVTTAKTPVKNADLIRDTRALLDALPHVRLFHVRGHVGIPGNEGADALARSVHAVTAPSGAAPSRAAPPMTDDAARKTRRPRKRPAPE